MRDTQLETAVAEAKRFIERVEALKRAEANESDYNHPRESGAVRRASMDLTRALADLRRP